MPGKRRAEAVDEKLLRRWPLPRIDPQGSKDTRGGVLVVGGAPQMPGAIVLAATAALRAGAGKLRIATVRSVAPFVGIAVLMIFARPLAGFVAPGFSGVSGVARSEKSFRSFGRTCESMKSRNGSVILVNACSSVMVLSLSGFRPSVQARSNVGPMT